MNRCLPLLLSTIRCEALLLPPSLTQPYFIIYTILYGLFLYKKVAMGLQPSAAEPFTFSIGAAGLAAALFLIRPDRLGATALTGATPKKALVDAAKAGIRDARDAYLPNSFVGDEVMVGSDNALPGSYYSFGLIPSVSSGVNPANNSQAAGGNMAFFFNEYDLVTFG